MGAVWTRRTLHIVHVLMSLVLIATGLLIEFPELRSRLVGGYGMLILQYHLWLGWAFMAVPAIALALAAGPLLRHLRALLGAPHGITWRKSITVANLASAIGVGASGVPLWLDGSFPLAFVDASLQVHIGCTWVCIALIPPHLFLARSKIAMRLLQLVGRSPEPDFDFPFEE